MNDLNSSSVSASPEAPQAETIKQLIKMTGGLVIGRSMYVIAELGIADCLKDGPQSAEAIAQATETHAPSLYRLLRSMTGFGFFREDEEHRFSLTPLGAALRSDVPGNLRSFVRMATGPVMWGMLGEFPHSVKTGETGMEKAFGKPFFDYLSEQPEQATLFNEMMMRLYGAEPPAIAEAYDFSNIGTLVDLGGGTGNLLSTILLAYPSLKGILYDLPHVVPETRAQIETRGLSGRCEAIGGSFFESVPEGGDAYMLSHIIHDWDEQKCLQIFENCRRAMHGRGRLLLIEMVIPQGNNYHPGKWIDLTMLVMTGGRERTEEEYAELLAKAGFKLTRVVPTKLSTSVVEAEPV
ncbi:MAG: methyltransferase [Spirulina sp.]